MSHSEGSPEIRDAAYWMQRCHEQEQVVASTVARLHNVIQELRTMQERLERIRERNKEWREGRGKP